MKRTEQERRERELKRKAKKDQKIASLGQGPADISVGGFIKRLGALFKHDGESIYNINADERILEVLFEIQEYLPEKQWDNVLRKAVKSTKVSAKEEAFKELKELMTD